MPQLQVQLRRLAEVQLEQQLVLSALPVEAQLLQKWSLPAERAWRSQLQVQLRGLAELLLAQQLARSALPAEAQLAQK